MPENVDRVDAHRKIEYEEKQEGGNTFASAEAAVEQIQRKENDRQRAAENEGEALRLDRVVHGGHQLGEEGEKVKAERGGIARCSKIAFSEREGIDHGEQNDSGHPDCKDRVHAHAEEGAERVLLFSQRIVAPVP